MLFVIEEKIIFALKIILSSKSPVFAAMFQHEMKKSIENTTFIKDISLNNVHAVIRYIYTGEFEKFQAINENIL